MIIAIVFGFCSCFEIPEYEFNLVHEGNERFDVGFKKQVFKLSDKQLSNLNLTEKGSGIYSSRIERPVLVLKVDNYSFVKLNSSLNGGGLYINQTNEGMISNSLFKECVSKSYGGAIYCNDVDNLRLERTQFIDCQSQSGSSLYYVHSGLNSSVSIFDCMFIKCYSANSGCIFVSNSYANNHTIESCVFAECVTNSNYGEIHFVTGSSYLSLSKVCMFECYSNYLYSMFYLQLNNVTLQYSTFTSSKNTNIREHQYFMTNFYFYSNSNCSNNKGYSSLFVMNGYGQQFEYSSIINNTFPLNYLVYFNGFAGNNRVFRKRYINIVNNSAPYILFCYIPDYNVPYEVLSCIFFNNTNILIRSNYYLILKDCYICHSSIYSFISYSKYYTNTNNTFNMNPTQLYAFDQFYTIFCYLNTESISQSVPCPTMNPPCTFEPVISKFITTIPIIVSMSIILYV